VASLAQFSTLLIMKIVSWQEASSHYLIRFWKLKIKVTAGGEGINVDAGLSKSMF